MSTWTLPCAAIASALVLIDNCGRTRRDESADIPSSSSPTKSSSTVGQSKTGDGNVSPESGGMDSPPDPAPDPPPLDYDTCNPSRIPPSISKIIIERHEDRCLRESSSLVWLCPDDQATGTPTTTPDGCREIGLTETQSSMAFTCEPGYKFFSRDAVQATATGQTTRIDTWFDCDDLAGLTSYLAVDPSREHHIIIDYVVKEIEQSDAITIPPYWVSWTRKHQARGLRAEPRVDEPRTEGLLCGRDYDTPRHMPKDGLRAVGHYTVDTCPGSDLDVIEFTPVMVRRQQPALWVTETEDQSEWTKKSEEHPSGELVFGQTTTCRATGALDGPRYQCGLPAPLAKVGDIVKDSAFVKPRLEPHTDLNSNDCNGFTESELCTTNLVLEGVGMIEEPASRDQLPRDLGKTWLALPGTAASTTLTGQKAIAGEIKGRVASAYGQWPNTRASDSVWLARLMYVPAGNDVRYETCTANSGGFSCDEASTVVHVEFEDDRGHWYDYFSVNPSSARARACLRERMSIKYPEIASEQLFVCSAESLFHVDDDGHDDTSLPVPLLDCEATVLGTRMKYWQHLYYPFWCIGSRETCVDNMLSVPECEFRYEHEL